MNGTVPLAVFNQSLARILYQEQRFGILGCDQTPVSSLCTNPGGVAGNRTGTANLPSGPTSGAPALGTFNGDAAVVERMSEEGATLLKNTGGLPLDASSLGNGDVLVTGANANHTVADPTNEASTGTIDRDAINPLQQLKEFSNKPGAFTYVPANDPTGAPVAASALSTPELGLAGEPRWTGPAAPATRAARPQRGPTATSWPRARTRGRATCTCPRRTRTRSPCSRARRSPTTRTVPDHRGTPRTNPPYHSASRPQVTFSLDGSRS